MQKFQVRSSCAVAAAFTLGLCGISPTLVDAAPDAAAPAAAAPAAAAPAAAAPAAAAPAAAAPAAAAPAAAASAAAAPAAAAPAVVGSYDVSGVSAVDKSNFEGVALVTKKGEAYQVKYEDSEGKYTGIAFMTGNTLGIAYSGENKPTICLMEPDGTGWKGQCIEQSETFLSKESWKRR
ncbi:MAG: hypothetical protein HQL98_05730 [Magnetococcales bacterium]|nr:hypothetical protein [Magnetococcales bacterium]